MSNLRFRVMLLGLFSLAVGAVVASAQSDGRQVHTVTAGGRLVDEIVVPGSPPPRYPLPAVKLPGLRTKTVNTLPNVPTLDWVYGCSPTSAAMMLGYYDNNGYPNLYTGPANGGLFPSTNAVWGAGQCPLSATRNGLDGRTSRGHVDDYWVATDSTATDPWISGAWAQHTYGDCAGDYMGTSQSTLSNIDGATRFYSYPDGFPLENYTACEPAKRDGMHGLRDFVESRGYQVVANYTQYILGWQSNTLGFTFDEFKAEIAAGRPVIIQIENHTMLGVGYDDANNTVYVHDTWDRNTHTMTWGGLYAGKKHWGVGVFRLAPAPVNRPPTTPATVKITPAAPTLVSTLTATAGGSVDPDGTTPTYEYEWSLADGPTWGEWGHASTNGVLTGVSLLKYDRWRVQARATDGLLRSAWSEPVAVTIQNSVPTVPALVTLDPGAPLCTSILVASADDSNDADGDQLTFQYEWCRREGLAGAWGAWDHFGVSGELTGVALKKGDGWRVHARAFDGGASSAWSETVEVTIGNSPPPAPQGLVITPPNPVRTSTLKAEATLPSDADGDLVTPRYEWSLLGGQSSPGGRAKADWSAWGHASADGILTGVTLHEGEQWRVRAQAGDGTIASAWTEPVMVTIGNAPPGVPQSLVITPAAPLCTSTLSATAGGALDADGDALTYEYQWSQFSPLAAGKRARAWGAWGYDSTNGVLVGVTLHRGDQWQVHARANDGTVTGQWSAPVAVTVGNTPPSGGAVAVVPRTPRTDANLLAVPTGVADADGDNMTYEFCWLKSTDGGALWTQAGTGATLGRDLTTRGERWKVQARASDGTAATAWFESAAVTIANTPPTTPTAVKLTPLRPKTFSDLRATASGATDADADRLTCRYQWSKSTDGKTWGAWQNPRAIVDADLTTKGEYWRARSRAEDGVSVSGWRVSAPVIIGNAAPTKPLTVTITPQAPHANQNLNATASGSTDADDDPIAYSYQWSKSTNGGTTWGAWAFPVRLLSAALTQAGEQWRVRARARDGESFGPWQVAAPVTIGPAPSVAATALSLTTAAVPTKAAGLQVTVSLSAAADVQLTVCNLAGRVVAVLPEARLSSGISSLRWSGHSNSGTVAPAGRYLIRLTARTAAGATAQSVTSVWLER